MTTPRDQHDPTREHADGLREQLSALIDGALPLDQARFLLRRLERDAALAGRWERWQLAGDVLRGAGPVALPAGFPSRVAEAIAVDGPASARARRWGRHGVAAALAASVAAVALFVARPVGEGGLPAPDTAATIAVLPSIDVPLETAAAGDVASVPQVPAPERVADVDMSSGRQAEDDPPGTARAVAPRGSPGSPDLRVADVQSGASNPLPGAGDVASPFSTPLPPEARPWPRAVLPGVSGGELFTAGYDPATDGAEDAARPFAPSYPDESALTDLEADPP